MKAVLLGLLAACCSVTAHAGSVDLPSDYGGAYSVKVKSLKESLAEIRFRTTVRQKFDYSCGSAAVATLLTHHYGQPVGEEEVIQYMYVRGDQAKIQREGFSLLDMKRYLEANGFKADGFEATLEQVMQFGAPGIVLIHDNGYKHFVVLKGVYKDRVLLGDPTQGSRIMARQDFERIWLGHLFFVIHSHRDVAKFNVPAHWVIRPSAFLGDAIGRDSLAATVMSRPDPIATDFSIAR